MKKNRGNPSIRVLVSMLCSAGLVGACGGGGGDGTTSPIAATPDKTVLPAPVSITGVVADGPLSGVVVCYDQNDNAACDSDEPTSALTTADGRYALQVAPALAGKHAVVAEVPPGAVDSDSGVAVGQAVILQAPATGSSADQSVFVSPLTSMVQAQIDNTGSTVAKAAAFVKAQAGLQMSPLDDFGGSDAASKQAAALARLAMLTMVQLSDANSGVIGKTEMSGKVVTRQDLRKVMDQSVLGTLPAMVAALAEPAVAAAATPADARAALHLAARTIVESHIGMSPAAALAAIGVISLPPGDEAASTGPGARLVALRFTDADNWAYRSTVWTAADDVVDADGKSRFYDLRRLRSAGTTAEWSGSGNIPERQGDLQWNGSAWANCPMGMRSLSTQRDAAGRSSYEYCQREYGVSQARRVDIGGATLRSVAETIRSQPGSSFGIAYFDWGPSNLDLLGSAVFPAGAKLYYQASTPQQTAPGYDARSNSIVSAYSAAVTAGGDARSGGTPVCAAPIPAGSANAPVPVANLEEMVARITGQPCQFSPGSNATGTTGPTNEAWFAAALSLGTIPLANTLPADTGAYYTTTALMRVAFVPGSNTAMYYRCMQRAVDGSTRNCSLMSVGSFSIENVGDARVMRFSGTPMLLTRLGYAPIFVEREGKVRFGFQTSVGVRSDSMRMNLLAANAVFAQLGIPLLVPAD